MIQPGSARMQSSPKPTPKVFRDLNVKATEPWLPKRKRRQRGSLNRPSWRMRWINLFRKPKQKTRTQLKYSNNRSSNSLLRRSSEKALNSSEPGMGESPEDARTHDPRRDLHAIDRSCGLRRSSDVIRHFDDLFIKRKSFPLISFVFWCKFAYCKALLRPAVKIFWLSQCHFFQIIFTKT